MTTTYDRLIYGKDPLERIVSIEVLDDRAEIFVENLDGSITVEHHPNFYWILSDRPLSRGWKLLRGDLHYRFFLKFTERDQFRRARGELKRFEAYSIWNEKEALMVKDGLTYFKGMRHDEVSILSFDIETTGLSHDRDSRVLLISNTIRKRGVTRRKLFAYTDYKNEGEMLADWCRWVREEDPSIMVGHNIFTYDLPYMAHVASLHGKTLELGRDGSVIHFDNYISKFRKDGSQFIEYNKVKVYGRELVDTFFLAIRHDIGRKYENYKLKYIVAAEGLEVEGRQHYDAGQIRHKFKNPEEWKKIMAYAEHDADDALALYDLMIPAFFYMTQSIPKSFQLVMESATGSMINSMMIRSYLQEGHGIPKASEGVEFQGALSGGQPGVYSNCLKWDVASLYPSIMLEYKIGPGRKDPKGNFLQMLQYFTTDRLKNKKLFKETGDSYYDGLQAASKQLVNSKYGFMGASGLNFNNPVGAALVTKYGREILNKASVWATGKEANEVESTVSETESTEDPM